MMLRMAGWFVTRSQDHKSEAAVCDRWTNSNNMTRGGGVNGSGELWQRIAPFERDVAGDDSFESRGCKLIRGLATTSSSV